MTSARQPPKTRAVCGEGMGGCCSSTRPTSDPRGDNDYGAEAIAELLTQMENHRDELIVIAAGYPKQMDEFLDATRACGPAANRVDSRILQRRAVRIFVDGEHSRLPAGAGPPGRATGRMARIGGQRLRQRRSAAPCWRRRCRPVRRLTTTPADLNQLLLSDCRRPARTVGQTDDSGSRRDLTDVMANWTP